MPRIVVPKDDLPSADLSGAIIIRFRISSDSRNSISEWSQIYRLFPPVVNPSDFDSEDFFDQGQVSSVALVSAKTSNNPERWNIGLTWQDSYALPQYDIYVRWLYDVWTPWTFMDSVAAKSYVFDSPLVYEDQPVELPEPPAQLVPVALDVAVTRTTYVKLYELEPGQNRTPLTVFNTVGNELELG